MRSRHLGKLTFVALAFVAGCAAPSPGPNAAASAVQADPHVKLATEPPASQEVAVVAANHIDVTFPNGTAQISPAVASELDTAARLFRDVNPVRMFVSGHSDNVGDEYANLLLSARRAQIVKQALVQRGIPADRLLLQAFGTSEPAVASDGAAPENRRVTVTWRVL